MSEISQLQVNGTTYDLCDATARTDITNLQESVGRVSIDGNNDVLITCSGTTLIFSKAFNQLVIWTPDGDAKRYVLTPL